jgi:ketosteroid isomerase-like protein
MSTEQNKAIVRKAIDALSRGDMAGFVADAADVVSFTLIGSTPLSGTIQGKQNIEKGLSEILGGRLEGGAIAMTIENLVADGEYVAEQAKGISKTKTGKDYNNTYCRVWRIVDGKVHSLTEYLDTEIVRDALCD